MEVPQYGPAQPSTAQHSTAQHSTGSGAYSEAGLVALDPAPEEGLQVGGQLLLTQQLHLVLLPRCRLLPTPGKEEELY